MPPVPLERTPQLTEDVPTRAELEDQWSDEPPTNTGQAETDTLPEHARLNIPRRGRPDITTPFPCIELDDRGRRHSWLLHLMPPEVTNKCVRTTKNHITSVLQRNGDHLGSAGPAIITMAAQSYAQIGLQLRDDRKTARQLTHHFLANYGEDQRSRADDWRWNVACNAFLENQLPGERGVVHMGAAEGLAGAEVVEALKRQKGLENMDLALPVDPALMRETGPDDYAKPESAPEVSW